MRAEENSKLISDLYNAEEKQEIFDILEYMGEAGDSIFVYPILDGYKKHRYSFLGYYFIWNLSLLDYPNLGKRLNELLETYEIEKEHIPMTLFFMAERKFFSEIANKMTMMYMDYCLDPEFRKDFDLNSLGFSCVLNYAHGAGILKSFEGRLKEIIFSDKLNGGEKAVAIHYLLEIKPEKQLEYLIANYSGKIRGTDLEKILAKKLVFLHSENALKLRKIMLENGGEDSAKFLAKYAIKLRKKKAEVEDKKTVYNCIDVAIKIGIMRDQINKKAFSSEQFGFFVFPLDDFFIQQSQCTDDKEIFLDMCADLLDIINVFNPEIPAHGLKPEEEEKWAAEMPEAKKGSGIYNFYLYLNANGVGVDINFFGLRQLIKTLELILENKSDKEFLSALGSIGIAGMYRKKEWHKIQGYLLNSYLQSLDMMSKVFNQFN